ncbi:MAG: hypothetical protein HKN11_10640 [Rhizobiales bacterium]|nr:hypothetical protein [Hyphomicrobiales bacterium]
MQTADFFENGWCKFAHDPVLADWVERTLPAARKSVAAPQNAEWLRCGGTWFAGVNVLPNNAAGAVPDGPPLAGAAVDFIHGGLGLTGFDWEPAQVSVCYPGYPQPMADETDAAYRYRLKRDAAHVDGLIPESPDRRRHLREHHGFLLGIPMVKASRDASPLVIWKGSHKLIREAFAALYADLPAGRWGDVDATEVYHATRRKIFAACERVEVASEPGEAYLVHRLALHGVAPWRASAEACGDGRMIVYFRPETGGPPDWLNAP